MLSTRALINIVFVIKTCAAQPTSNSPSAPRLPSHTASTEVARITTAPETAAETPEATPKPLAKVGPLIAPEWSQLPKLRAHAASLRDGRRDLLWSTAPAAWRRPVGRSEAYARVIGRRPRRRG